jgi:hypothetical protein
MNDNDPIVMESGIFAAKSILDALDQNPKNNTFVD